ncbi:hypothetical protein J45TS6_09620 [Paenibacillus sp. J45TS6]|nr:hypothetical protein J45TS6_09620 [Paenibacillus sp. J45TS6]
MLIMHGGLLDLGRLNTGSSKGHDEKSYSTQLLGEKKDKGFLFTRRYGRTREGACPDVRAFASRHKDTAVRRVKTERMLE